jgi:hypothetical protein
VREVGPLARTAKQEGPQSVLRKFSPECILHELNPSFQVEPMLNFLLALMLLVFPLTVEDKAADPDLVKQAVAELKQAHGHGRPKDQLAAIQKYRNLIDSKVAGSMLRGLKSKDISVKLATIEALRWMPFPETVKAMQKSLERDKLIKKDERLLVAIIRSLGQHSDPSSLALFEDGAYSAPSPGNIQARLYSIARIRTDESLSLLMEMLVRGAGAQPNGKDKNKLQDQYDITLEVLTGETFKRDQDAWLQWWRENRKSFKVAPKNIKLSPKTEKKWSTYWANPQDQRGRGGKKKSK